jgi:hypothetical protein
MRFWHDPNEPSAVPARPADGVSISLKYDRFKTENALFRTQKETVRRTISSTPEV